MATTMRRRRRRNEDQPGVATRVQDTPRVTPEPGQETLRPIPSAGILELHPKGYGFLRDAEKDYHQTPNDVFVPAPLIQQLHLRPGNRVEGIVRERRKQEGARLEEVHRVDGLSPEDFAKVKTFDQLTPVNPETWLRLEIGPQPITTRVMDILTPLGKGQPGAGSCGAPDRQDHFAATHWPRSLHQLARHPPDSAAGG